MPIAHTIGLRDGTWLDRKGSPLTEAAKITERSSASIMDA
jgi:hypothetical protein